MKKVNTADEFESELRRFEAMLLDGKISLYDFIKAVRLVFERALKQARRRTVIKVEPIRAPPQQSEHNTVLRNLKDLKKCPKCGLTSFYVTIPWEAWGTCLNPWCAHQEVHNPETEGWLRLYEQGEKNGRQDT